MIIPGEAHEIISRGYYTIAARSTDEGTSNALGVPGSFPAIVIVSAMICITGIIGSYKAMAGRNSSN